MTDFINLCIADICLAVSCQDAVLQDLDSSYRSFYGNAREGRQRIDIRIYPELPNLFDIEKLEKIFDTEQSWSMFRKGADCFIAINPQGFKTNPICVARFDSSLKEVQIYCNNAGTGIDGKKSIINPFCYPLDRLLMMYILAKKEGAMLHAAGVIINGKGYIFPGSSGAGKSTLSRQFSSDKDSAVLTDERVIVRKFNGKIKVFGTPWPGEAGIAVNRSAPLSDIFFIHHGTENKIKEIKPGEALQRLLPVTSIPWYDPEIMTKILHFCEDLISRVSTYELYFTPDDRVIDFLEEFTNNT